MKKLLALSILVAGVVSFTPSFADTDTATPATVAAKFDEQLIVTSDLDPYTGKHNLTTPTKNLVPVSQQIDGQQYQFYLNNAEKLESNYLLPLAQSPDGTDVSLRVKNPTDIAYFVSVPSQNINLYVPLQSERSVVVNLGEVGQGKTISYFLTTASGEKVAQGYIMNGVLAKKDMHTLSQSQYSRWGQTLQQIIAANQYKAPVFEAKAEPKTLRNTTPSNTAYNTNTTVRGYW